MRVYAQTNVDDGLIRLQDLPISYIPFFSRKFEVMNRRPRRVLSR